MISKTLVLPTNLNSFPEKYFLDRIFYLILINLLLNFERDILSE